ncbi:hypothetical protein [Phenylobacterium sp.]|uniref:O-linked N-acetylglucosamine transferase, SPINDLY family protein n=1 Tax=Phenylobacterium sp. TaxID=1871053 RepID=UPI0035B43C99
MDGTMSQDDALAEEIDLALEDVRQGRAPAAVERLRALIAAPHYDVRLHYALSAALGAAGDREGQRATLADAQTFHAFQHLNAAGVDLERLSSDLAYATQVGQQFYNAKLMGPAAAAFGQAALRPGAPVQVLLSWGLALQHQGRIDEALIAFEATLSQFPSSRAHEFLLYISLFAPNGVRRHAEEVRRWAELYAPAYTPGTRRFANKALDGRRLKIGYVAPSFTRSQLKQFILPVLDNHDSSAVEVVLYSADAAAEDAPRADAIRTIGAMSDDDAAALIQRDGVDVLVDLWGHTAGSRLGVFARKAAPVQAAWINYVQSTGVPAMDYVIHADGMATDGVDELFTEKIWRIGPIMAPFRPGPRLGPSPTPALRNGYVTFGSFNHPVRLNDETVAAWARILNASPESRLVLKYGFFIDPILQRGTRARFAAHGVPAEAIEFQGHSTGEAYLQAFGEIDLALDPSPCPGGTTSSDAVSNGVPLLTLRGADFYSRIGTLRLEPLGLDQLIAESWDDYVARALAVTADAEALNALRSTMQERFDRSAIRDEAGFTRRLEDAFGQMYQRWWKNPSA